jgi:tetratricopeptide (TPR) repeat protein
METAFADDLRILTNALRYEGFRFILIGHNRHSLYVDITKQLRTTFTDRPFLELQLRDKPYRQIIDEILAFPNGIMLIPDFDWLLQPGNETVRVGFNQRRDAFARRNVAFICFIGANSWRSLAEKLPDWWSLRSLELDFHREDADETIEFLPTNEETSSLGGETKAEKEAEIERLLKQLDAVEPTNKPLRWSLNNQIGKLWHELSYYETALPYFQQALRIAEEIGDKRGEGTTLNDIGEIHDAQGDYETALTYLQQSLSIQQEIGDKRGEGTTLNNISQIYDAQGDYETALIYLQQSLSIQQEIGDKRGEGATLNNLATPSYARGDYETALTYLQQSLRIRQGIGDKRGEGTTLNNISQIYDARGDYETALTYLQQSLSIQQEIGDKSGEGTTLNNLATLSYAQGDYKTALTYLQQSLSIQQEIGDKSGEATTFNNMGVIYLGEFQDIEQAMGRFWPAYTILKQIGSPNAEITKRYLDYIQAEIGAARFAQLVESLPTQPLP